MAGNVTKKALEKMMIAEGPSYANKFFYSLGFLSMVSFMMLLFTGIVMTFYGPTWWLTSSVGKYFRSLHLWSTQAFVLFIFLHLLVVFLTSGFKKPRRLTWVLGVLMFLFALIETEFGYVLRGDFSSQWRALQGADFYNGSGIGGTINALNYKQIYGIHIAVIPFLIMGILGMHYLLVRTLGIAKPYRKDVQVKTVAANHKLLFLRGGVLVVIIAILAVVLPSPFLRPTTIKEVADSDPTLAAKTFVAEFTATSDTSTYMDNIDPYRFDVRSVFVEQPYNALMQTQPNSNNFLDVFKSLPDKTQADQLKVVSDYYSQDNPTGQAPNNLVSGIVDSLVKMAQSGQYEATLAATSAQDKSQDNNTYDLRFLADTGVLEDRATGLGITTEQYGMLREETSNVPGAWWLAPIGVLNHTVLSNDDNGDRDGAIILGLLILSLAAFPFIPIVNQLPDKLRIYKFIWKEKQPKKS